MSIGHILENILVLSDQINRATAPEEIMSLDIKLDEELMTLSGVLEGLPIQDAYFLRTRTGLKVTCEIGNARR
jgi:hypothetical protein